MSSSEPQSLDRAFTTSSTAKSSTNHIQTALGSPEQHQGTIAAANRQGVIAAAKILFNMESKASIISENTPFLQYQKVSLRYLWVWEASANSQQQSQGKSQE